MCNEEPANINEAFMQPKGGYGRIFEAMYTGSMIGVGVEAFALMPYVISNMRIHPELGAVVELNPVLLAFIFEGQNDEETVRKVEQGIARLCQEDPRSRNSAEGGRRLVKVGQFLYRVVNGAKYNAIRRLEANRAANSVAVAKYRAKKENKGKMAREIVREAVESDPITKSDRAALRRQSNHDHAPATTATKEYDLDYSDERPPEEDPEISTP